MEDHVIEVDSDIGQSARDELAAITKSLQIRSDASLEDVRHHYLTLALDRRLYTAPLKAREPWRILDLGTGTGKWCVDVGNEHPTAEVLGVDISPVRTEGVPSNVRFEVFDFTTAWAWPENHFDYIHIRILAGMTKDWPHTVQQAYRALKPGGYLELQDQTDYHSCDDNSVRENSVLKQWINAWSEAMEKMELHWLDVDKMFLGLLEKHGFEDVGEKSFKVPTGPWPKDQRLKEMGLCAMQVQTDGVKGVAELVFTKVLGWSTEDVQTMWQEVKEAYCDPQIHAYMRLYCIYGRKPE